MRAEQNLTNTPDQNWLSCGGSMIGEAIGETNHDKLVNIPL
jgi:hypothetical protein